MSDAQGSHSPPEKIRGIVHAKSADVSTGHIIGFLMVCLTIWLLSFVVEAWRDKKEKEEARIKRMEAELSRRGWKDNEGE